MQITDIDALSVDENQEKNAPCAPAKQSILKSNGKLPRINWAVRDTELQALRELGLSFEEIGQRMGISGNAAASRAYRIGLIRTTEWSKREAELRLLHAEGLPLAEIARRMDITKNAVAGHCHRNGITRREFNPYTPPPDLFDHDGCLWPIGNPDEPGFHFCGDPKRNYVSSYCSKHAAKAYTRVPKEELTKIFFLGHRLPPSTQNT